MTDDLIYQGEATYTCDMTHSAVVGPLYYFSLKSRSPGPYKNQKRVEAIIDVADDGTLAGVELVFNMPAPPDKDRKDV